MVKNALYGFFRDVHTFRSNLVEFKGFTLQLYVLTLSETPRRRRNKIFCFRKLKVEVLLNSSKSPNVFLPVRQIDCCFLGCLNAKRRIKVRFLSSFRERVFSAGVLVVLATLYRQFLYQQRTIWEFRFRQV